MSDEQIAIGLFTVFICFPALIVFFMSRFSLWSRISRQYSFIERATDRWETLKLFSVGYTAYRRCVQVSLSSTHIHFRQIPPFSLFLRPFSIPYEMVTCSSHRNNLFFVGFENYSFSLPPELFATLATRADQDASGGALFLSTKSSSIL